MPPLLSPKRSVRKDYDLYKGYVYYAPDVKGMFVLFALLLLGNLLGSMLTAIFALFMTPGSAATYGMIFAYPAQFLPPMVYCAFKSRQNALFEPGISLESSHFKPYSGWMLGLLVIVMTAVLSFATDWINYWNYRLTTLTPGMKSFYDAIMDLMKTMTGGPVWVSVLTVAIMAPVFEEWLCRGEILRGLLQKMKPGWAIVVSALFFAVIHMNPWQALNAFIIGCVLGYVYYKTGSLILTMLMHATNNGLAVLMSNIDSLKDVEYFKEIMPAPAYLICTVVSLAIVAGILLVFRSIPLADPRGNLHRIEEQPMD